MLWVSFAILGQHKIPMAKLWQSPSNDRKAILLKYLLNSHGRMLTLFASCGYKVMLTCPEDKPLGYLRWWLFTRKHGLSYSGLHVGGLNKIGQPDPLSPFYFSVPSFVVFSFQLSFFSPFCSPFLLLPFFSSSDKMWLCHQYWSWISDSPASAVW